MIALGLVLAILGYFFSHILMVLGIILLVVGLVFHFMGTAGRPVGGRRTWY
jgi:low temperature requirement protein LtrA